MEHRTRINQYSISVAAPEVHSESESEEQSIFYQRSGPYVFDSALGIAAEILF